MSLKIKKTNPPINSELLMDAEKSLRKILPDDYKSFLLLYNGGIPETKV